MQKSFIEPPLISEDSKMETPSLKGLTVLPKTRHANGDVNTTTASVEASAECSGPPERGAKAEEEGLPLTVTVEGRLGAPFRSGSRPIVPGRSRSCMQVAGTGSGPLPDWSRKRVAVCGH